MPFAHPVIAIIVLFVIFFAIFFVLIFGILQYMERKRRLNNSAAAGEEASSISLGQVSQPVALGSDVKFCLSCGSKIPVIADYCPNCGAAQINARASN